MARAEARSLLATSLLEQNASIKVTENFSPSPRERVSGAYPNKSISINPSLVVVPDFNTCTCPNEGTLNGFADRRPQKCGYELLTIFPWYVGLLTPVKETSPRGACTSSRQGLLASRPFPLLTALCPDVQLLSYNSDEAERGERRRILEWAHAMHLQSRVPLRQYRFDRRHQGGRMQHSKT